MLFMRTFLAINPPMQLKSDVFLLASKILSELNLTVMAKPVEEKNLHATLRFLGEISHREANRIVDKLKTISFPSFELCFDTLSYFTFQGKPRVVFLQAKSKQFNKLMFAIDQKLKQLSIPLDKKPPVSHITLFRIKEVKNLNSALKILKNTLIKDPFCFKVVSFELMKSVLSPKGPAYEIFEKFDLI